MVIRIITFYFLTFLFTFILGGVQQEVLQLSPELSAMPQWGPGIAALLMLLIFRKDKHRLNFSIKDIPAAQFIKAFLIPLIPAAIIFPIVWLAYPAFSFNLGIQTAWPLFLLSMAIGAIGEEMGWRGYLHKHINKAYAPLLSISIVTVLWLLWHVGLYQNGLLYMLAALVAFAAYTTSLYILMQKVNFNIWVAALFHFGINMGTLVFLSVINSLEFMALYALVWALMASVLHFKNK